MIARSTILSLALLVAGASAVPPDATERALREAGMLDVLEARLLDQLAQASDDAERSGAITRLAAVYQSQLDAIEPGSPAHEALSERAWTLADRAGLDQTIELRLSLLIHEYLPIERSVALYEVDLLDEATHARQAIELGGIHRRLRAIAERCVPEAVRLDRLARVSDDPRLREQSADASRLRSLSSYYAAWSGLMLAVLEDRRPGNDILPAFGWMLGAEGGTPKLDDVRDSALALDHVARSAIGVARTKQREGETVLAGMWFDLVIESSSVGESARGQAIARRLRMFADEGDWSALLPRLYELLGTGSDRSPLPASEARYLAIRALAAQGNQDADRLAALALGDLVTQGEIGHVLDLRRRFGSLPMLEDGFVGRYAEALDRLERAEETGSPVRYLDCAEAFARSAAADDANRFVRQRDDAMLKQIYCLVRAGRPAEAITRATELTARADPIDPAVLEEASWLLIIAYETSGDDRYTDALHAAVRDYIDTNRGSARAQRLLVRYAGTEVLPAGVGIDGLREIAPDDPIAADASRTLIRLLYQQWVESGRLDQPARDEIYTLIEWLWSSDASGGATPRARLDTARIVFDVSMGAAPTNTDLASDAIDRAERALEQSSALAVFGPDLRLSRIELLCALGRFAEAIEHAGPLRQSGDSKASRADRVILASLVQLESPSVAEHRMIVAVGARALDTLIPPAPEEIGASVSAVVSRVIASAVRTDETQIAASLGRVLLTRGSPTAQAVREVAEVGASASDQSLERLAWSVLLAASQPDELAWWEARYHGFRLQLASDPDAARKAYEQHRVLHPVEGPEPWGEQIRELFAGMPLIADPAQGDGARDG